VKRGLVPQDEGDRLGQGGRKITHDACDGAPRAQEATHGKRGGHRGGRDGARARGELRAKRTAVVEVAAGGLLCSTSVAGAPTPNRPRGRRIGERAFPDAIPPSPPLYDLTKAT